MSKMLLLTNNLTGAFGKGSGGGGDVLNMLTGSGPVATIDLIIILIFSILSWAIIFYKIKLISSAKRNSRRFYAIYNKNKNEKLSKLHTLLRNAGENHVANIFKAGYYELVEHHRVKNLARSADSASSSFEEQNISKSENIHILERALSRALSEEVTRFERGLFFLATTGTTCPFLGLFGTIWGVMNAFGAIGRTAGAPNLASIAPGISEALITTAAGLIAAIPAAVAYNLFVNSIKVLITDMENFSLEFLSLVERRLL